MKLRNKAQWTYYIQGWRERALAYARTLKGRELSPDEQEILNQARLDYPDDPTSQGWEYFRVFGIQADTQQYIDCTIRFIENLSPDDFGEQITYEIRLKWSSKALKGIGI